MNLRKKSNFSRYTFPFVLYFAMITRPHRCDIWLVDARRCYETRMWLVLRFSCARGGDEPGIGFGVGMTRKEERRMSRLSQASLFGFSPSRDLPTFSQHVPSSSLSRESRLSSHLSLVTLSSFLGGVPRDSVVLRRGYILSSRNNKLTLLNLSWAAFRSSILRQQRAPAYLSTNIVTVFNSIIYLMLHAF